MTDSKVKEIIEVLKFRIEKQKELEKVYGLPKGIFSEQDIDILNLITQQKEEIEWLKHCKSVISHDEKSNALEVINDVTEEMAIYTKDNWLVLNMESQDLGKAIKTCIEYLIKNARGEDNA